MPSTVVGVETEREPERTLHPLAVHVLVDSGLMALSPPKNMGPLLPLLLLFPGRGTFKFTQLFEEMKFVAYTFQNLMFTKLLYF